MVLQFALFTVLVIDDFMNGLPVATMITEKEDAETLAPALAALGVAVQKLKPDWKPACFLVDDDAAEHNAIR